MKKLFIAILFVSLLNPFYIQPVNAAEVTVSHFIGSGGMGDNDGTISTAKFSKPSDIAIDNQGNVYVLDSNGVRKIDKSNQVTTVYRSTMGINTTPYCGITVDKDSNIWFSDCRRSLLYKVSNDGNLLKTINIPYAQTSWLTYSPGVEALPDGSILLSLWYDGKILQVSPSGVISTFFQNSTDVNCGVNPKPTGLVCPIAITTTPSGEVYVLNQSSVGNIVGQITSRNNFTKIATPGYPTNLEYTNGALYVSSASTTSEPNWLLYKVINNSSYQLVYQTQDYNRWNANGFKFLNTSTMFLASPENQAVKKIDISSGAQTLIGNVKYGSNDGSVSQASVLFPSGITEDNKGNLFFLDYNGIRKVDLQKQVSTIYKTANSQFGTLYAQNEKMYFYEDSWIKRIDANGKVEQLFRTNLTGENVVLSSNTLAVNKSGQVFLVMYKMNDYGNKFIRRFNPDGSSKDLPINFANYSDLKILLDQKDALIVANNGVIRKYVNEDYGSGNVIGSYTGYNQVLSLQQNGDIYISSRDQYTAIINVIKSNGVIENLLNGPSDSSVNAGVKSGFSTINGIHASANGDLYLSDSNNNAIRLVKFSATSANQGSNSNSNSSSTVSLRKPRDNSSWSRPSGLLPGLSEVRFEGYFNDKMNFFSNDAKRTLITKTLSDRLPIWNDSTEMGTNMSIYWGGYFIPDVSGVWDFQMTSDDASFLWIGNEAVSKYWYGYTNADIAIAGSHPPVVKSTSLKLEANKVYPFRIFYGNEGGPAGSFKLEVKPPSFKTSWDTNLEGLIWHSDFSNQEDCTNFGISYTLSAKLGYDIIDVPACKNNPAKIFSNGVNSGTPVRPIFNAFNISGNTLNLNVNIGAGSNKPDKVYLVAPQLGINIGDSTSSGKISGSNATWAIPLTSAVLGKSIQLQFISNRDGVDSDPLVRSIAIPNSSTSKSKNQSPPLAATSPKYVVSGAKIVVSAKIQNKVGANPVSGYLTAEQVGITAENAILGKISGNQITFTMPLLSSMMGKKTKTEIYMVNEMGESKPLAVALSISAPKQPTIVQPNQRVQTVICRKGIQTRTFAGKKCPPGWN